MPELPEGIDAIRERIADFIAAFERDTRVHYAERFAAGRTEPDNGFSGSIRRRERDGNGGYRARLNTVARDFSLVRLRFRASPDIFLPLVTWILNTYGQHGAVAGENQLEINIRILGPDHEAARRAILEPYDPKWACGPDRRTPT